MADEKTGWRDIASAPRDGQQLIVMYRPQANHQRRMSVGFYHAIQKTWFTLPSQFVWKPTHWMPLPEAPISHGRYLAPPPPAAPPKPTDAKGE